MPGYKRGSYKRSTKRALTKKYGPPKRVIPAVRTLQAAVRRTVLSQINKNVETKQSVLSAVDGQEILHNNFITLDNVVLQTTQGVQDPIGNNNTNNRIGDEINLKGVSIKLMTELNERYSNVQFRLLVVKCAKGDTPTRATLWKGQSDNKLLDVVNNERYTILAQKVFKMNSPNLATWGGDKGQLPSGTYIANDANTVISRATRIVKMWIPGNKFTRSGVIKYENGSSQTKFFDYHVLLYAYANYSTLQDIYNVGRLNDYVKVMYYKDA